LLNLGGFCSTPETLPDVTPLMEEDDILVFDKFGDTGFKFGDREPFSLSEMGEIGWEFAFFEILLFFGELGNEVVFDL